jgi:hypothetical protein
MNMGARYGVEEAFKISKGKYICRFDGDDVWPSNFLSTMSAILDQQPGISMVYSDVAFINDDGIVTSFAGNINRKFKHKPVLENEFIEILKEYYINAPTIMFRREAFASTLPMPSELKNFIDFYMSLKVLKNGKAYYLNQPMAYYRIHNSNGHKQVIRNGTNVEVTEFILRTMILDNPGIKEKAKRRIIGINYFRIANDYFGVRMFNEARKYYLKAGKIEPAYLFNFLFLKRLLSVMMGYSIYIKTRKLVRQ